MGMTIPKWNLKPLLNLSENVQQLLKVIPSPCERMSTAYIISFSFNLVFIIIIIILFATTVQNKIH